MANSNEAIQGPGRIRISTRNGEEAVELAKSFDGQIDLALLDIKLPDIPGDKVYSLIMEARPKLKVIIGIKTLNLLIETGFKTVI
ncbi:MAG: hypothetical protein V1689_06570 [Pseudomonadota bacterium]